MGYNCYRTLFSIGYSSVRPGWSAPVICNHCSARAGISPRDSTAPPPLGNSGDNDFSSITALLKALHCGHLLRVIAMLFMIVLKSHGGVYLSNITSPALRGVGNLKGHCPPHVSPALNRWGWGQWCIICMVI